MNVMLNIPADSRSDRPDTPARRTGDADAAGNFGALFDAVAPAPDRGTQFDPSADAAEAVGTPDDGGADGVLGRAYERRDGDWSAQTGAQEEVPGDAETTGRVPAALAPAEGQADGLPRRDRDAATDSVKGRNAEQTEQAKDSKALPADSSGAGPAPGILAVASTGAGDRFGRHTHGGAAPSPGPDSKPADGKDDGTANASDAAAVAASMNATAAPSVSGAVPAPVGQPYAARTDRAHGEADTGRRVPSGDASKPAKDAAGSGKGGPRLDGREAPSASARPAVAEADSAAVRRAPRDNSIAVPVGGGRQRRADASPATAQDDRPTALSRRADRPVSVRVTAYERHLAPLGASGGTKAASPTDDAKGASAPASVPEARNGGDVAAGSAEAPSTQLKDQSWQTSAPADRGASSARATEPPEQRVAQPQDPAIAPDPVQPSEPDPSEVSNGKTADAAASARPTHADEKPQSVGPVLNAGGNPTANASAPASPLVTGVAAGIANALGSARDPATAPAMLQRIDATATIAATGPVRTIALTLDMRDYGQVDIRISLKGDAVSIQLKAERAETAAALARDDASLRDLLHRAGYETQQIQVDRREAAQPRLGDAPASGQQQPAGGAGAGASFGQAAGDQRAPTPGERPQAERGAGAFVLHDQDTQDAPRQDRYRGPDRLYV